MNVTLSLLAGEAPVGCVTCQWEAKNVMSRHSLKGSSVGVTDLVRSNPTSCLTECRLFLRLLSRILFWTPPSTTEIWGFRVFVSKWLPWFHRHICCSWRNSPHTIGTLRSFQKELPEWVMRHLFSFHLYQNFRMWRNQAWPFCWFAYISWPLR